jgi:uncharacterized membrane protein YheB (UPF0754 family)
MPDITIPVTEAVKQVVTEGSKNSVGQGGESQFAKLLDQQGDMSKQITQLFGATPEQQMKSISAEGLEINSKELFSNAEIRTHDPEKISSLLGDVNNDWHRMEGFMELVTSGKKFAPAELLALQAGVHQIALHVDLIRGLMETTKSSLQATLNTNFGG